MTDKRKKACHVGAPAIFKLELACKHINEAFGNFGCYLVGSSLERPNWHDVDVRFIMEDARFDALFPDANTENANWEFDARWLLLTAGISAWLSEQTGLPVDFQIQRQSFANERHNKPRHHMGLKMAKRSAL